jgi:hypothetical protein
VARSQSRYRSPYGGGRPRGYNARCGKRSCPGCQRLWLRDAREKMRRNVLAMRRNVLA